MTIRPVRRWTCTFLGGKRGSLKFVRPALDVFYYGPLRIGLGLGSLAQGVRPPRQTWSSGSIATSGIGKDVCRARFVAQGITLVGRPMG